MAAVVPLVGLDRPPPVVVGAVASKVRPVLLGIDDLVDRAGDIQQVHLGVLGGAIGVELPPKHPAQGLDALADTGAGGDRHADVGLGNVDALDEGLHRDKDLRSA